MGLRGGLVELKSKLMLKQLIIKWSQKASKFVAANESNWVRGHMLSNSLILQA